MAYYKRKSLEEKKQEIETLTKGMEQQILNYFVNPESIKEYLDFMGKFHQYSINNSVLINQQFEGAETVGSFKFWRDKGFSVKKGEKGIKVLVPKKTTYFRRDNKEVQLKFATKEEKEKINNKEIETYTRIFFDIGHVFDVSQTNATANDLPKIFPNRWLEGNVKNYQLMYQALEKVANKHGVKIVEPYQELGVAKGVSYTLRKEVALNPRNSELQNVKTLAHELAHAVLHTAETHDKYSSQEKEFQAEMVAYTVSSYFGLDTTEYSLPYLYHWTKGKELKDQRKLLYEVRETAHDFISTIEEEFVKERGLKMEKNRKSKVLQKEIRDKLDKSNSEKQLYWYEMWKRPVDIGCQPKGFVDFDNDKGRHGIVAYDRPLTEKELNDYDMKVWKGDEEKKKEKGFALER